MLSRFAAAVAAALEKVVPPVGATTLEISSGFTIVADDGGAGAGTGSGVGVSCAGADIAGTGGCATWAAGCAS
ncbi:MAG: hypothetical protein UX73_C0021G0007 [candidate division WWE3 bacterium GW2011_GWC1_47_10]|uniref:Uncharacterized protein n=1 Tax=candidate division WWE3 bacterium GW2011_GWC1_47_10 TaxID=1619122 RepID=A0A0G1T8J5_UNCKA|nr:MAG: hypothetical protein UX73_C0021G0007 [candidate division WWE3 bacterium GW2011_GWC1_47_10]